MTPSFESGGLMALRDLWLVLHYDSGSDPWPETISGYFKRWLRQKRNTRFHTTRFMATNSPDLNAVNYKMWVVVQQRVYQSQVHNIDELKQRSLLVWPKHKSQCSWQGVSQHAYWQMGATIVTVGYQYPFGHRPITRNASFVSPRRQQQAS